MRDTKGVGLRLPEDVLEQIDELAASDFEGNRSTAIRHLIMLGLERDSNDVNAQTIMQMLEKQKTLLELVGRMSYIGAISYLENVSDYKKLGEGQDSRLSNQVRDEIKRLNGEAMAQIHQTLAKTHGAA